MIDLHSHVLPGIDDGPADLAASLALVRGAAAAGTTVLAATPHLRSDFPGVRLEEIAPRCVELNRHIPDEWGIRVVPGAEVDLLWAQNATEQDLKLASYWQRGTHLLVETPYQPLPAAFEELVFQLSLRGFQVVLAHPERNATFQKDTERLAELVRRGVLVQVTAQSLAREDRRSKSRRLSLDLVQRGLAHVIASDAHSAEAWRGPELGDGVAAAEAVAPNRARWMVTEVPEAILAGEPMPPEPSDEPPQRRGFLRRLAGGTPAREA